MAGLPSPPIKGLSLLFLKVSDVSPPVQNNQYTDINGLDIIHALEKVTGRGTIEGAQRMKNLFRIYCKTKTASNKLSTEGFCFDGRSVSLYTHNPFTVRDQSSDTVKIIIGGVPLSVANDEFEKALVDLNVEMVSDLKFENYRDEDGKWTEYKTGRRFVYCKKPSLNLKTHTKIGLWYASIYYQGQVRPKRINPQTDNGNMHSKPKDHVSTSELLQGSISSEVPKSTSEQVNKTNLDTVSTCEVNTNSTPSDWIDKEVNSHKHKTNDGKSGLAPPPDQVNNGRGANKTRQGKSPARRGRSQHKRQNKDSQKQKRINSMFKRSTSPSISRSRNKREYNLDSSSHSPPSPKSNARSNSFHADWFDVTVETDFS